MSEVPQAAFPLQLQVGIGANNTICCSLVTPQGCVASWNFDEAQAAHHIAVMERHLAAVRALNARPQIAGQLDS